MRAGRPFIGGLKSMRTTHCTPVVKQGSGPSGDRTVRRAAADRDMASAKSSNDQQPKK